MFRLPKSLKNGDMIEISGSLGGNPKSLSVKLTTGMNKPDDNNIVCMAEANFNKKCFNISGCANGKKDKPTASEDKDLIAIFPDGKFKIILRARGHEDKTYLDIDVFESNMGTRELKHNIGDVTFLKMAGDLTKIEDLKFIYA